MAKTYYLKKDISHPMGSIKAGTASIHDETTQGYFVFPYIGHTYNEKGSGWLGNGFMIYSTAHELSDNEWYTEEKPTIQKNIILPEDSVFNQLDFAKKRIVQAETEGEKDAKEAWTGYCSALRWVLSQNFIINAGI